MKEMCVFENIDDYFEIFIIYYAFPNEIGQVIINTNR